MRITFEKVRFKKYLVTRQKIFQTKCDDLTCCGKVTEKFMENLKQATGIFKAQVRAAP